MAKIRHRSIQLNRQHLVAFVVLLLSFGAYWWLTHQAEVNLLRPTDFRQAMDEVGGLGIIVYISLIALAVIISPIPGAPLTVAAGAVWGTVWAGIYSVIGGFLGGLLTYFIGRSLGRSAVYALTGKIIYFEKRRGEVYLGGLIFVTRLLPILSFDLISYGAGISGLSLPIYASATLLGMIPSTFLLTYLGATFHMGWWASVLVSIVFVVVLIGLPWMIRRYNWLGLRDSVHVDSHSENVK